MLRSPLVLAALTLSTATCADAALVHRYSFNGNVNDSIGGAHGAIIDAGESNVVFADGKLDVSSNAGVNYFYDPSDAYVSLPGPILNNAFVGGVEGEMTIEIWSQSSVNRTWAALFSAGHPEGGIGILRGYFQIIPQAWDFGPPPFRVTSSANGIGPGAEESVDRLPPMSIDEPTHLVVAFHLTALRPFPRLRYLGGFSMYVDGALIGSVEYDSGLQFDQLALNRTWLGRSQFDADPIFDGVYDELRIYNSRLTAAEIARSFQLGPNVIPEPGSLWLAMAAFAAVSSLRVRSTRKNRLIGPV
jgi:hypothetical protein